MLPRQKAGKVTIRSVERRQKSLALRKAGLTYVAIGQELGISEKAVRKHVLAALALSRDLSESDARDIRTLELERLDALLVGVWGNARKGDAEAVRAVIRIMERRAKLLGLDAKTEISATVKHEVDPHDALLRALEGIALRSGEGGETPPG